MAYASAGGRLRDRLSGGGFAVTAELGPPRAADPGPIRRAAAALRGRVDAVNITDNQNAHVRVSALAGAVLAMEAGVEPVLQVTCRDRNRIALQSDLLGAGALGVPNVLLMTGDHPRYGDHADAAPVFDLDGTGLLGAARAMRDEGRLLSGRPLDPPPGWLVGAVVDPFTPPAEMGAAPLAKKVAAGAEFVQTQYVFDVAAFARWMRDVRDRGLDERCHVLAGVGPIRSLRALEYLSANVPGVRVPEEVTRRLRGVPGDRVEEEGVALCAETIAALREVPGVRGVHVMAPGFTHAVPELLDRAGLPGGE